MANKTVADLTSKIPALTDIIPVADPTTGVAGKSLVSDVVNFGLPTQSGNSGKYLTTNGTSAYWDSNPLGTVTSVGGNGAVNGLSLSGTVTSSGNITLGGTLSGVDLTTAVSGILPVANGGTGTSNGSITGTGALVFQAGGSNEAVSILPTGTGKVRINTITVGDYSTPGGYPYGAYSIIQGVQRTDNGDGGILFIGGPNAKTSGKGGAVSIRPGLAAGGGARGYVEVDGVVISDNAVGANLIAIGNTGITSQNSIAIGWNAGNTSNESYYGGNVYIGLDAGRYYTSHPNEQTSVYRSICLGYRSCTANNNDSYSIVIGAEAVGDGANTTVIGKSNQISARLNGYTKTKSLQETVYTITDGASVDINPANGGIQTWTLGANRTPTASSFAEGQSVTLMVDDGTAYAITWSSISPTWIGGSAPTLATTGYTVIELWKRSSTIYGALVGTA